jgi:hypothetical protein
MTGAGPAARRSRAWWGRRADRDRHLRKCPRTVSSHLPIFLSTRSTSAAVIGLPGPTGTEADSTTAVSAIRAALTGVMLFEVKHLDLANGRRPTRPAHGLRSRREAGPVTAGGRSTLFESGGLWRRSRPRKPPPPWTGRIQGGGLPPCGCDGCRRSPGIEVLGELPLPGLRRSGHRAHVGVAPCRCLLGRGLGRSADCRSELGAWVAALTPRGSAGDRRAAGPAGS